MIDISIVNIKARQEQLRQKYLRQLESAPRQYIMDRWNYIKTLADHIPITWRFRNVVQSHGVVTANMTTSLAEVAYPPLNTRLAALTYHTETNTVSPFNDGYIRRAIVPSAEGEQLDITDKDGNLIARITFADNDGVLSHIGISAVNDIFNFQVDDKKIHISIDKPVNVLEVLSVKE